MKLIKLTRRNEGQNASVYINPDQVVGVESIVDRDYSNAIEPLENQSIKKPLKFVEQKVVKHDLVAVHFANAKVIWVTEPLETVIGAITNA